MCRQLSEGGRRCQCDNSRKRKMRRLAAALRVASSPVEQEPNASTVPGAPSVRRVGPVTMDSVRAAHALAVHDIHDDSASAYDSIVSLGAEIDALASRYTKGFSIPISVWNQAFQDNAQQEVLDSVRRIREINEELLALRAEGELDSSSAEALRLERSSVYRDQVRRRVETMRAASQRVSRKLATARLDIISELRPLGGSIDNSAAVGNHRNAMHTLNVALESFPSAWIEASNNHGDTLRVRAGRGRGSYRNGSREVIGEEGLQMEAGSEIIINNPGTRAGVSLAIHEFSHRVQSAVPQVSHFEEIHLARRRTPYADAYMTQGSQMAREMLPCAITGVTTTAHGSLMGFSGYSEDEESRHFALGVLASV